MLKKSAFFIIAGLTLLGSVGCSGIHDILSHTNEIIQLLGALDILGFGVI
jgi:hypothetical protein